MRRTFGRISRKMALSSFATTIALLGLALHARPLEPDYFVPSHRLPGIGAGRRELTEETLARRIEAMIQAQTFSIMREPQAMPGARRIYAPGLQRLFRDAGRRSGFPVSVLQAIAYLESWGNSSTFSGFCAGEMTTSLPIRAFLSTMVFSMRQLVPMPSLGRPARSCSRMDSMDS